ncbi:MAG TPA: nucleoside phosphorylase [Acidimicrobiales bacterium]|nr:nucleoside phosphorylase [Acidimicrobiales bacterium]
MNTWPPLRSFQATFASAASNTVASRFPQHEDKHHFDSLVRPEAVIARYLDDDTLARPSAVIISYSGMITSRLKERGFIRHGGYPQPWRYLWLRDGDTSLGVVEGFGYGAPGAAIVLEELIAFGATRFVNLGIAGALPREVAFGDLVLCTKALRDEGVSHHYAAAERFAHPSPALRQALGETLIRHGRSYVEGPAWTIDALFRETREEAERYRDEGIVAVDMETAALFVIAATYGVDLAALFVISDHLLAGETWSLASDRALLSEALGAGLSAAIETLSH